MKRYVFPIAMIFAYLLIHFTFNGKKSSKSEKKIEQDCLIFVSNIQLKKLISMLFEDKQIDQICHPRKSQMHGEILINSKEIKQINKSKLIINSSNVFDKLINSNKKYKQKSFSIEKSEVFRLAIEKAAKEKFQNTNNFAFKEIMKDKHIYSNPKNALLILEAIQEPILNIFANDESKQEQLKEKIDETKQSLKHLDGKWHNQFTKCKASIFAIHEGFAYSYLFYPVKYEGVLSDHTSQNISAQKINKIKQIAETKERICILVDKSHYNDKNSLSEIIKHNKDNNIRLETIDSDGLDIEEDSSYIDYLNQIGESIAFCMCENEPLEEPTKCDEPEQSEQ